MVDCQIDRSHLPSLFMKLTAEIGQHSRVRVRDALVGGDSQRKEIKMRTLLHATFLGLALGLIGMSGASALPANGSVITSVQPIDSAQPSDQAGSLLQVADGCGRGWHWSFRWRHCVPNWRWR
jgi:hypothetical protein